MIQSRFTETQIVEIMKEAEAGWSPRFGAHWALSLVAALVSRP